MENKPDLLFKKDILIVSRIYKSLKKLSNIPEQGHIELQIANYNQLLQEISKQHNVEILIHNENILEEILSDIK
ncbi:14026_t:CDS:1, partial [Dentiscutata heterogama]